MSAASNLTYKLRPNKAVDRELFLSLLNRLNATLNIENYKYIGLGGPFMEDFRLIHARIGLRDMDCIEKEEKVYKRQIFNKPIESVSCIHTSVEEYLDENDFEIPVVLWLDFSEPKSIQKQIETYSNQVLSLPVRSIIRITLNANPTSLGKPDPAELAVSLPGKDTKTRGKSTELEWRLERFKERLADYCPANLTSENMTHRNFGKSVLEALHVAVEKTILDVQDRKIVWILSTHYSDGQPMVTATLLVLSIDDIEIHSILQNWEFYSNPKEPLILDLPGLSTRERLTMESSDNPKEILGFDLPRSHLKEDPYETFKKFYRVFPQFARIDF